MSGPLERRWLGIAPILAAVAAWVVELVTQETSVGLFFWLAPAICLHRWVHHARLSVLAFDALRLAGITALLYIVTSALVERIGLEPLRARVLLTSWIHASTLAPALLLAPLTTRLLRRALRVRRSAMRDAASSVAGQGLALLPFLPITFFSMNVHVSQGVGKAAAVPAYEAFAFEGAGGVRLAARWYGHAAPTGAVLVLHGHAIDQSISIAYVESLYRRGFDVMSYDQRNHGHSTGLACTFGIAEAKDCARAWRVLLDRTAGTSGQRLLYGFSMGAAPARLAAPELASLDGLVLDSAYADFASVAARRIPAIGGAIVAVADATYIDVLLTGARLLRVAPAEHQRAPRCPTLVFHSVGDPIIPLSHAQRMVAGLGSSARLVTVPGKLHARIHIDAGELHANALADFIARLR